MRFTKIISDQIEGNQTVHDEGVAVSLDSCTILDTLSFRVIVRHPHSKQSV